MDKEKDKHKCEVKWDKHKSETASTSEFGIGKAWFKTNNRIFQVILLLIFLSIVVGVIFLYRIYF